jgi:hypothetical protein
MAGHGRGDLLQRLFGHEAAIDVFEVVASARSVRSMSSGRRIAGTADTHTLVPPKSSISKPNRVRSAARQQRGVAGAGQVHDHRHEQALRFERAPR